MFHIITAKMSCVRVYNFAISLSFVTHGLEDKRFTHKFLSDLVDSLKYYIVYVILYSDLKYSVIEF